MQVPKKTLGISGGLALALALGTSTIAQWEGKKNDPYVDMVGVQTVCYGETRVRMKKYTDEECLSMLSDAVSGFQKEVLKVNPNLRDHPYQLAAATSLAYNIGSSAYKNSTVARKFKAGDLRGGCDAFSMWTKGRVKGKLVTIQGLVNRRKDEIKLCYQGF